MNKRLLVLYALLICFLSLGAYAAYSFFSSLPADTEEEPYEFADLSSYVEEPDASDGLPIIDVDQLRTQNSDYFGWLFIPDTIISFPVVKAQDNSYYLKHGFDGSYSSYGCPFLDTRTSLENRNMVIHGHNMGNNRTEMFSPLLQYQAQEYGELHDTAYLMLPDAEEGTDEYRLFAVLNFDINTEFDYLRSDFLTEEDRTAYISYLKEHSIYTTDFTPEDVTFILSTCNRTYGADNRLLICFGR